MQDLLLMLLTDDIAHKEYLFPHEQLIYVVQDLLLMLLDDDIGHKIYFIPS